MDLKKIQRVVFDWKRTLYDPDSGQLIDGAWELLEFLQEKKIPMILIGKGGEDMHQEVERLGVKGFFEKIIFAEGEKDPDNYRPFMPAVVIGDRVRSELAVGKSLGATTIWVKQGKFAEEGPENDQQQPDNIVSSLHACATLLRKPL